MHPCWDGCWTAGGLRYLFPLGGLLILLGWCASSFVTELTHDDKGHMINNACVIGVPTTIGIPCLQPVFVRWLNEEITRGHG